MKFLCLDRSTATAQPIVQNDDYLKLSLNQTLVGVGGIFIVVGCMALVIAKYYRQNSMLKKKLNAFENYGSNNENRD